MPLDCSVLLQFVIGPHIFQLISIEPVLIGVTNAHVLTKDLFELFLTDFEQPRATKDILRKSVVDLVPPNLIRQHK